MGYIDAGALSSEQAQLTYDAIVLSLTEQANEGAELLEAKRTEFKEPELLGVVAALHALGSAHPWRVRIALSKPEVQQWRSSYEGWFEASGKRIPKRFREKAHVETLELFEELEDLALPGPAEA